MTTTNKGEPTDVKLEVVVIGVSDVDRAKAFYEKLGWRLDADFAPGNDFRVIQFTPHSLQASIIFGKGVTPPNPDSVQSLTLAVGDINAARDDLIARGVEVSKVLLRRSLQRCREKPARQRARPGGSFLFLVCLVRRSGRERLVASGNQGAASRLRMEIIARGHDGRRNAGRAPPRDGAAPRPMREDARKAQLVELVRAYLNARQNGSSPDEAAAAANRYLKVRSI
jgi:predicted enzyme related to lactoylglutathione lyase